MEPSGVSVEVTKLCTNKDHCQSGTKWPRVRPKPGEAIPRRSFTQIVQIGTYFLYQFNKGLGGVPGLNA